MDFVVGHRYIISYARVGGVNSQSIYYLGTDRSYNIRSKVPGVDCGSLSDNNFIVGLSSWSSATGGNTGPATVGYNARLSSGNVYASYNASSCVLTINGGTITATANGYNSGSVFSTAQTTGVIKAYLVVGAIKAI